MRAKPFLARFLLLAAGCWLSVVPAFAQAGSYPQVDLSGYKKWEYKKVEVSPQRNYFSGLTQLGGYYPTLTGGPLQERLQLKIMGELSKDLSVSYDLEQEPEIPERYDVKVKYFNNELTFGDFSANFTGNEFASASKFLNGVMLTAKDSWYDVIAVPSSKLKSQTQNLTTQQGNNTKGPYNLGHGSIVEGSERIEVNNILQVRNIDYTIDYFEGKVTFNRILIQTDEFKYSFEYTNVIDLFFPTLSKRDFLGLQSRFTLNPEEFGQPEPKPEPITDSTREIFPSPNTTEAEEISSGQFYLAHAPLVEFSEKVTFMGTQLKRNEDYLLRYTTGALKLLTRFMPTSSETLAIEYSYYQTSAESESIPGVGSQGPYLFSHRDIVTDSEKIEVDSKPVLRGLNYTIDYASGQILFNYVIGPTSLIKATYASKQMFVPERVVSKYPRELKIGGTYLKEAAKKSAGTSTATYIESISGQTIITRNKHIYLQNRPVVPTTESGSSFIVKLDGRTLTPEVDYFIPTTRIDSSGYVIVSPEATIGYVTDHTDPSNGYQTGTIKLASTLTVASTSQVTVTYTYYKNVIGKFSSVGNGTRGPYYLRNIRNVAPGTETVQVWDQGSSIITNYIRNSSFEADAGALGYSINYNADNPSITFNNDLPSTKNFQILYQYVPPQTFAGGDISQSVYGFDGSFKIGDIFKVDTAYAKSESDRVYIAESTSESFSGNGSKSYTFHSPQNIVEGSEKISANNKVLNRDIDYYMSYTAPGQVTFYYITPTTLDAFTVTYQYQSTTGIVVGQGLQTGAAYRLGAETKLFGDVLSLSGSTKHIDFDFSPLGSTTIGIGSRYKDFNLKFDPQVQSFNLNYSYKENNNPIGSSRDRFLRTFDHSVNASVNPKGLVKIDANYRNYRTLDDVNQQFPTHTNDSSQESYGISLVPSEWSRGVLSFTQGYELKQTSSKSDVARDSNSYSDTTLAYGHASGNLKISERFTAGYDYQLSEPKTIGLKSSSTEATTEALSSHAKSTDTAYNFTLDLTFGKIQKWTARVSLLDHKDLTLYRNFTATDEAVATRNETYHMDFDPISILNTSFDHNRQERLSFVVGGANPKTDRSTANVRFTPISWLSGSWSGSQSDSIPETGAVNRTTGKANSYTATWLPFSFERFKLSANYSLSDNIQTAPSGSLEGIRTETDSFNQNYAITILPHPNVPVNVGVVLENYKNFNNHPVAASRVDTETANKTYTAGLTFTPIPVINITANYSNKITEVVKDMVVSPEARAKSILSGKLVYQPWSWGTLAYERENEHNGGEVQGGSVANIDYEKTTQVYSANLSIPIDNAVVSSFVLIGSLKQVSYKNLKNSADDFSAALMTFEGSLNF